jgi:surface antigen
MNARKLLIGAGIAVGIMALPVTALAATAPPQPKQCDRKHPSALTSSLCATYDFARNINNELNALKSRVAGTENKAKQLEAANAVQDKKIATLEQKVAELEKKLTPPADPCHGYPANLCNAPIDSIIDPWGYFNRESVSWVAYKLAANGRTFPYNMGNAKQWPAAAQAAGFTVNGTPKVGAAGISTVGAYGHAVYVEEILDGGAKVRVSQFNATMNGAYSEATLSTSQLVYIHF